MSTGQFDPDNEPHAAGGRQSVRELMLVGGLELLERHGLGLGPSIIGYARVFRHLQDNYSIRVTRGSVHERIWPSHDDYRREVVTSALRLLPPDLTTRRSLNRIEPGVFTGESTSDRIASYAELVGDAAGAIVEKSPELERAQALLATGCRLNDPEMGQLFRQVYAQRAEALVAHQCRQFLRHLARAKLQPKNELGLTDEDAGLVFNLVLLDSIRGWRLNRSAGISDVRTPFVETGDGSKRLVPLNFVVRAMLDFLYEGGVARDLPEAPPAFEFEESEEQFLAKLVEQTPERRSRSELRQLVVAAGVEILANEGYTLRPDSLRYSEVLKHIRATRGIGIHRSSVHGRLWATQEDYQMDVLTMSVSAENQVGNEVMNRVIEGPVPPVLTKDKSDSRRGLLRAKFLQVALVQSEALLYSTAMQRELLIKASLANRAQSAQVDKLRTAIIAADEHKIERYRSYTRDQLLPIGYRVRPELGITTGEALTILARTSSTQVAGSIFSELAGAVSLSRAYDVGRGDGSGATDRWPLNGIAAEAFFHQLFTER